MNQELQTKVVGWLETAGQKIGDFAANEIPPFIHEYLNWKFWEAGADAFVWMIPWVIGVYILLKWKTLLAWANKYSDDSDGASFAAMAVSIGIGFVLAITCFPRQEIKDMLQIKIAPKVYLVEKASEIVKGQ